MAHDRRKPMTTTLMSHLLEATYYSLALMHGYHWMHRLAEDLLTK